MKRSARLPWVLAALLLSAAGSSSAQAPASGRLLTVERYLDFETVADPRASPDGKQVVYTRRSIDRGRDQWVSSLWIVDDEGGRNRFLVEGSQPVWSPDGTRLAYVAPGMPAGPQIFVRWMDASGATSQVTRVERRPGSLRWSPDGTQIGFSMPVPSTPGWRVKLPSPPPGATWTSPPTLVERLKYKADRVGLVEPSNTHLFVVPATGGTPRDVTPGDWSVGQSMNGAVAGVGWDWLRDGRTIVVEGNDTPDGDRQFRTSSIYLVDLATGDRRSLTPSDGFWTSPTASPDGKLIAYTGFARTEATYQVADLYTVTPDGSERELLTEGFDRSPSDLVWDPDSDGLYFVAEDRGAVNLYYAPKRGRPRALTTGTHVLGSPSVSKRNSAFVIRSHFHRPPDVVRINLRRPSDLRQLTFVNDDVLQQLSLGEVEEIWYTTADGTRVQGWIVKPPFFELGKTYPMILEIHGGPHAMYNVAFDFYLQVLAANGFVVLYTNPRGSTGYGSAFGNAVARAYPGPDYDDLMAGVDSLLGREYVDSTRLYVGGCSGGGILTSWIIGHTDRFAAATVRCPITNWISAIGTSDVTLYGMNFFERPFWEDPAAWLRQSPLMYVGNVKTPTLLMTGVDDLRTPMGQTEEYFAALKLRGVPAAMVRFEGESHGTTSRPSNWMRTAVYVMEWYRRWSGATP